MDMCRGKSLALSMDMCRSRSLALSTQGKADGKIKPVQGYVLAGGAGGGGGAGLVSPGGGVR